MAKQRQFGSWTINEDRCLGRGGNGEVWVASKDDGATGALKMLQKRLTKDSARLVRFNHEIDIMKRCANIPGVLPILDSSSPKSPDTHIPPWLVTPIAEPLTKIKDTLDIREAVSLCCELADTLRQMHNLSMSHRDLKPDNIFLLDRRWCLGDFGLADSPQKESLTENKERLGPVFYIAPEMLNDAVSSDGQSADVYSIGKILWVLVSNQEYPIPGEHQIDTPYSLASLTNNDKTIVLDGLIAHCSKFDPAMRPSMDVVYEELQSWLNPMEEKSKTPDFRNLSSHAKLLEASYKKDIDSQQSIQSERENETSRFLYRFLPMIKSLDKELSGAEIGNTGFFSPQGGNARFMRAVRTDLQNIGSSDGMYFFEIRLRVQLRTKLLTGELSIGANIGVPAYDPDGQQIPHDSEQAWGAGGIVSEVTRDKQIHHELLWGVAKKFNLNSPSEEQLFREITNGIAENCHHAVEVWLRKIDELNSDTVS